MAEEQNGLMKKILAPVIATIVGTFIISLGAMMLQWARVSEILQGHETRITKVEQDVDSLSKQSERLVKLEVRSEIAATSMTELKQILLDINEKLLSKEIGYGTARHKKP